MRLDTAPCHPQKRHSHIQKKQNLNKPTKKVNRDIPIWLSNPWPTQCVRWAPKSCSTIVVVAPSTSTWQYGLELVKCWSGFFRFLGQTFSLQRRVESRGIIVELGCIIYDHVNHVTFGTFDNVKKLPNLHQSPEKCLQNPKYIKIS